MRTPGIILTAILMIAVAGCGSGTEIRTVVQTIDSPATTPATRTGPAPEPKPADETDCDALGINTEERGEGRCTIDGQRFAVVNRPNELRLKTVAAKIDGITFVDSLASDISSETPSGMFAVITLTVRNRSDSPQTFSDGFTPQTALFIGRKEFSQDFDAENGAEQSSFAWQGETLQPGASQTGTIVFDVPKKLVPKVEQAGSSLAIVDFGVDLSYDDPREVGIIRLAE